MPMPGGFHHGCLRPDAWSAQEETNKRFEKSLDKIDEYMMRQTTAIETMARQGEQITDLRRDREEDHKLIEQLFRQDREQKDVCTAARLDILKDLGKKADNVPWWQSVPVYAALVSTFVAVVALARAVGG